MVGSRQSGTAGGASGAGSASGDSTLLDEVCLNLPYSNGAAAEISRRLEQRLENVVDNEIIPRLALLHQKNEKESKKSAPQDKVVQATDYVDEFTALILRHESGVIVAYVKTLLDKGLTLEALLLDLLAPSARRLGRLWEDDVVDFVDVTIATSRLQQIVHHFTMPSERDAVEPRRRVLLLPTPGEQHTFGLLMASEFFRRDGWHVWGISPIAAEDIPAIVARQWFATIGFSLSCERLIDTLCSTIKTVRRFSRNRAAPVIVGGRIFAEDEDAWRNVDADLVVADAREAVKLAEGVYQKSLAQRD